MINIVDRFFSFNRLLLLLIGLWPYERSKYVQLQFICVFSFLISSIIFQLTTFLTSKCTPEFIIKILSSVLVFSASVVEYNAFYVNSTAVKYLMEQVQCMYKDLTDTNEIAIVERYGSNAKYYVTRLAMVFFSGAFLFVAVQLLPEFRYFILSGNVSRTRHLQISTEYFIDQERYFYLVFFHINGTIILGCVVITATGLTLITYLQHACGMFRIASYRIDRAIQNYISKNVKLQNEILAHKGIIRAVNIHRQAITYSTYLISKFEISFMFLIAVGVMSTSLNIYRVFQVALLGYNIEELFISLVFATLCFVYMFVANFVGQQIIDHNNHVYATAYKVQWYVTPLHIQRLILLILQRGNKNFGLSVGGLFTASIECFATLTNASISYFTIMYSMR
ncbi:PREDICTED: odorant receptor 22c-like [Vollenhovia emeryi]|uniref:odorant receptor 22c-like n=1 Tax=Vollenhovia emeryi TaxID=411798 RepID=UPI0005F4B323|nr:PREDICTED: odorant receptor 22c-like [Vollenhovia emeryi]